MENSSSYSEVDLSSIKKPKIHNDQLLESEVSKICEVLRDTSKLVK